MIEEYKEKIIEEVNNLYLNEEVGEEEGESYQSIIFFLNGSYYLSVYNDKVKYIFDKEKNLYQNIIFELQVRKKLSMFDSYYFYINSVKEDSLNNFYIKTEFTNPNSFYEGQTPVLPQFEPTGEIYELEDMKNIFENLDILTDYLLDKKISKEDIYSLMISPSFDTVMEGSVPAPGSSGEQRPSKFVDLSKNIDV